MSQDKNIVFAYWVPNVSGGLVVSDSVLTGAMTIMSVWRKLLRKQVLIMP